MNSGEVRAVPPVRIELATSEIEGGPCRAWADPVQVMAAVAVSQPGDTFAHYVLPPLDELTSFTEVGYSTNGLPVLVQAVLERLQDVHVRLWRENASGLHGLRSSALTCIVAEEDRVYFVKTSSAWVCLLRGGKAHPVERLDENADESSGLGAAEKLGLSVTSLPVLPGDIVVILASEMNWAPDLRAVVNVFGQTADLKRACDGLVNLLGLQSEGAGAVAFRFIPVGAERRRDDENPLADLAGPVSLAQLGAAGAAIDAANRARVAGEARADEAKESSREPEPDRARCADESSPAAEEQPSAESTPADPRREEPTSEPERAAEPAPPEMETQTQTQSSAVSDPFADMTASMPPAATGGRPAEPQRSEAESFLESLGDGPGPEWTDPSIQDESRAHEPPGVPDSAPMSPDAYFVEGIDAAIPGASAPVDERPEASPQVSTPPATTPPATTTPATTAPQIGATPGPVDESPPPQEAPGVGAVAESAAVHPSSEDPSADIDDHVAATPPTSDVGTNPEVPGEAVLVGAAVGAADAAEEAEPLHRRPPRRDDYRGRTLFWPVLVAVLLGLALGMAALPGGVSLPGKDLIRGWVGGGEESGPTGLLHIESDPPPRRILVEGQDDIEGSVARIEKMPIGQHRVALDLGPCGIWETEVDVREGQLTELRPILRGRVEVAAADPTRSGKAWVEGGTKHSVPTTLDGLQVGWNRVFYEDEGLPIWERQVLIRTDKVASLLVPNNVRKGEGLVKVEALVYRDGLGLIESGGDSIWVDDSFAGVTPLESRLDPGLHSVRVRWEGQHHTEMLDLHGGGASYVVAQFGLGAKPRLRHVSPGTVELQGSLVLTAEVESEDGSGVRRPMLHFPHLDSSVQEIPLSQVEAGKGVWVAIVEPQRMPRGESVQYYFSATTGSGESVYSDLYSLTIGGRSTASSARVRSVPTPSAETPASLARSTTSSRRVDTSTVSSTESARSATRAEVVKPPAPTQKTVEAETPAARSADISTVSHSVDSRTAGAAPPVVATTKAPTAVGEERQNQPDVVASEAGSTRSEAGTESAEENGSSVEEGSPLSPENDLGVGAGEHGSEEGSDPNDPANLFGTLPEVERKIGVREAP